jgi:hypothetical protein
METKVMFKGEKIRSRIMILADNRDTAYGRLS